MLEERLFTELDWRIRVFESLSFPTLILKPSKVIMTGNRIFLEKYDLALEAIVGKSCSQIFYEKNLCPHRECPFFKVIEEKKGHSVLRRRKSCAGNIFWEERLFSPILDDKGEVVYVMESIRDVTRLKNLEITLKETEAFLEKIILNSPIAIIVSDRFSNILLMNPAAENLLGYVSTPPVMDLTMEQLHLPGFSQNLLRKLRDDKSRNRGKIKDVETEIIDSYGRKIPVEVTSAIIYENDEEVATVNLYTDLREKMEVRKKLESTRTQLAQSEKMASIGQLAAGVAHEINNPLTGILFYAGLRLEKISADDPEYEELKNVIEDVNRCKDIVRNLLAYSRRSNPLKEIVHINTLLETSLSLIRDPKIFGKIRVVKFLSEEMMLIHIDKNQISQVIINLVMNAISAMNGEGTITFRTYRDPKEQVCLEISDTGCGIKQEDIPKIFDPFFTTKETGKGTGLGLSTAYGLVNENKGSILVKETGSFGTTFLVTFQLYKPLAIKKS